MENKSSLFGIIAIIIGASGLGVGAYSIVNFQIVEGPQGLPGDDGVDGQDAPGGLVVGILDPDHYDTVWGEIEIRALVYGSNNYSVSVIANQTQIGAQLPTFWNTSLEEEGWYNLTVLIIDIETKETASDTIWILIENPVIPGVKEIYTHIRSNEEPFDTSSGWVSVFMTTMGYIDMYIDVEEGDVVHLRFAGLFMKGGGGSRFRSFCFYDVSTVSPIGEPVVAYFEDSVLYRQVTLETYAFFMTPGVHRIDVCSYDPFGLWTSVRSLTIQT
ncbi:MAG: hypothetical protein ACFFCI_25365, partial [Promethearchaeota archaeon]